MLKKFREWLTRTDEKREAAVRLMQRVELSTHLYEAPDGTLFDVSLADPTSVKDILTIQKLCYDGKTPWNHSALTHEIRYNRNAFYVMVHQNHEPAAFIGSWLVGVEAHITNIAVVPKFQQMGIASFLIEELKRIAIEESIEKYSLEVRVSNYKARNLYEKLGFKKGRIKKEYYAHDHEDALEMTMDLEASVNENDFNVPTI